MPITVTCGLTLKIVGALLLAVLPISVKTNSGKLVEGDLDRFTEKSLLLNQASRTIELAYDDLTLLQPEEAEERTGPPYGVTLVGGSRIAAQDLRLTQSELLIEPRRQNQLRVPIKQVKAIRFRKASAETDAQWLGNLERESRGDSLVIRRPGNRLDPQQGVVLSIENGKVGFDLEGTVVNAPIDRLEGVIFGGTEFVTEDAEIQVTDVYGSRWSALAIRPSQGDQPLQLQLTPSLKHEVPLHQVFLIRWSGGVALLCDAKPAAQSLATYVQTDVDTQLLADFFGPEQDGDADLVMFGGSSIEYRIESGYRLLAGAVRRHEGVTRAGKVTVRIELDGKTVWEQQLVDAEPRGFELPVGQSRRLAIKVDSGDDGDLGDKIRVSRPRLLK